MIFLCIDRQYNQIIRKSKYLAPVYSCWLPLMKPCIDYALDYIYRYPKTEKELRIQLIKKWYTEEEAHYTMIDLVKRGYVDDRNFATMYIESELIHKGKPRATIMSKLLLKGIDKDLLKELMTKFENEASESINVRIRKEIDKLKERKVEGVALIQKLMMRGYTLQEIKKCIKANTPDE